MTDTSTPAPRPVCFMVMPFGEKSTHTPGAPDKVDFTHLWHTALKPGIEACGFRAVRADEDIGTVILKDMIERLVAADVVLAEVSVANANVYYELGLRHAARETGCVMVAADWARPVFDIAQITRFTYPLPQAQVCEEQAESIKSCIKDNLPNAAREIGPVHRLVPGYPDTDKEALGTFQDHMDETYGFQTRVRSIELLDDEAEQSKARKELVEQGLAAPALLPSVATGLLELIRDTGGWNEVLDYVRRLPDDLQRLPVIIEQQALALSKTGQHAKAIANLEPHIDRYGGTPESYGILGGRYKEFYSKNGDRLHLNKAIDAYEKGWRLDLNAYYPGNNLPLLLRERGEAGDFERAAAINNVIIEACEAARAQGRADEWINATLLGQAFVTGKVDRARELVTLVKREGATAWRLESTLRDLKRALLQLSETEGRSELDGIYSELEALAPRPSE